MAHCLGLPIARLRPVTLLPGVYGPGTLKGALDYSTGIIATAYLTDEPCLRCTLDLIARGCRRVVYSRNYTPTAQELLERFRVIDAYGNCLGTIGELNYGNRTNYAD